MDIYEIGDRIDIIFFSFGKFIFFFVDIINIKFVGYKYLVSIYHKN
jgi:hypothetical protein